VTPAEGGALAYLEGVLGGAGFTVHRPVFSAPGTPDVENLYARYGAERPCLLFAGHTDVVPPGDPGRWRHDPFSGQVEGGEVFGRGAVDMKGGIACMAAAALSYLAERPEPPGSIAFLITGDEEGPAVNGTVKLLAWAAERGERFDHCVLGEPTNPNRLGDMIKIGRRGSLTGHLVVHGTQGHVAYPHLADNPIRGLMRLADALLAAPLDAGTAHFDASNLELTSVDVGNPAANVIPAEARATFNAVAFLTRPDRFTALVADAIEAETGLRPALSTTGGTSDARFIKDYCPVLEFGLVGQTMHQVDERVAVADLDRLAAIYRRLLDHYFST
jgi:succinyl-diaminopimelate desuccinylase